MIIKFKTKEKDGKGLPIEIDFTVKEVNTPKFRKETYHVISGYVSAIQSSEGTIGGIGDFFYPETDGEIKPCFKELFEKFLEGDFTKIDFNDYSEENATALENTAKDLLTFFLKRING